MKKRTKNNLKAVSYVVIGGIICVLSVIGFVEMCFSETFIPTYVAGKFMLGNLILRCALSIGLVVIFILSAKLASYGMKFLIKRYQKRRRRC